MGWSKIYEYAKEHPIQGLSFELIEGSSFMNEPFFEVQEIVGRWKFLMRRGEFTGKKLTESDDLGLVGLNSLDLTSNHCFLTEGVSDFISVKLKDNCNVLGVTTLSGNVITKAILSCLFDNYTIIGDNDVTGIKNMAGFRRYLLSEGKQVKMQLPPPGYNDINNYITRTFLCH